MTAKKAVDILREADLVICGVKPSMRSFPWKIDVKLRWLQI
jgi:hypothetical protein